jgi:galactose mutarotase-like enzyme
MTCDVTYVITDNNELEISYYAVSDQKTTLNMTNHLYFNLNGCLSGDVLGHELMIKASRYTPVKMPRQFRQERLRRLREHRLILEWRRRLGAISRRRMIS